MKREKKGFTLAELLIVVAIIAVLVAIAIPVFTRQLERSREATDLANVRSAYAALVTGYLDNASADEIKVKSQQKVDGWNYESGELTTMVEGEASTLSIANHVNGAEYTVSIDASGAVTVK